VDIFLLVFSISTFPEPPDLRFHQDIYASIHPNPRIPVNITPSRWNGYCDMMFIFGFVWGGVNILVYWVYFCSDIAFGSVRRTLFTLFVLIPIAPVLILGPFFSPWIALPLARKVRDRLSFIISKQRKITLIF
jgi:hypothetical protein